MMTKLVASLFTYQLGWKTTQNNLGRTKKLVPKGQICEIIEAMGVFGRALPPGRPQREHPKIPMHHKTLSS